MFGKARQWVIFMLLIYLWHVNCELLREVFCDDKQS